MPGDDGSQSGAKRRPTDFRTEASRLLLGPDFHREREVAPANLVEAVFEPVAIAILVASFITGAVTFGLAIAPQWDVPLLAPICLTAAMLGFFYTRRLARPSFIWKEWITILVPLALVDKLVPYVFGTESLTTDFAVWMTSPASFFSASYIVDLVLIVGAWSMATSATHDLNSLRLQKGELPPEGVSSQLMNDLYESSWHYVDHGTPLRNLTLKILWGGVALVALTGLAALGVAQAVSLEAVAQLFGLQRPTLQLGLSNVLLYFVVGLALIAEAQLVRQNTAWKLEHLEAPSNLPKRWIVFTGGLVLVALFFALVLPTDYVDLVTALVVAIAYVLGNVATGILLVFYTLLSIILWPLSLLMPHGGEESSPRQPAIIPPAAAQSTGSPLFDTLKSVLIALAIVTAIGYSLFVIWRQRRPLPAWMRVGLLGKLVATLGWLFGVLGRWGRTVRDAVATVLPRMRPAAQRQARRAFGWVSLSRLSPRQLVEYFYLSTLERAAKIGHGRVKGETPLEYRKRLPDQMPGVEEDFDVLTRNFLEARYGPRIVEDGLVRDTRSHWERLKRLLKGAYVARLGRGPRDG